MNVIPQTHTLKLILEFSVNLLFVWLYQFCFSKLKSPSCTPQTIVIYLIKLALFSDLSPFFSFQSLKIKIQIIFFVEYRLLYMQCRKQKYV